MIAEKEIKYCQSCIERGFNPPQIASREWQTGIYYCDDCFGAIIANMTSIPEEKVKLVTSKPKGFIPGPILSFLYEFYSVPVELQFDGVDTVCRNHDKIFNFHAPAIINRTLESVETENEQLSMSLFIIQYKLETLSHEINRLKEINRKARGLVSYSDSKEVYAKGKPKVADVTKAKLAAKVGLDAGGMDEFIKKAREREFNKMAGNCLECGGSLPCANHPGISS